MEFFKILIRKKFRKTENINESHSPKIKTKGNQKHLWDAKLWIADQQVNSPSHFFITHLKWNSYILTTYITEDNLGGKQHFYK